MIPLTLSAALGLGQYAGVYGGGHWYTVYLAIVLLCPCFRIQAVASRSQFGTQTQTPFWILKCNRGLDSGVDPSEVGRRCSALSDTSSCQCRTALIVQLGQAPIPESFNDCDAQILRSRWITHWVCIVDCQ